MVKWGLKLVTAPKEEPVLFGDVKVHLRVTDSASDTYIQGLIAACRLKIEGRGIAFLTQEWDCVLDAFPARPPLLKLPRTPVQSVTSIKYLDAAGVEQTLPTSDYIVDLASVPARITPAYDKAWPDTRHVIGAVTVRFKAGWIKESEIPADLKLAVLGMVAHFYEQREAVAAVTMAEVPEFTADILESYRLRL